MLQSGLVWRRNADAPKEGRCMRLLRADCDSVSGHFSPGNHTPRRQKRKPLYRHAASASEMTVAETGQTHRKRLSVDNGCPLRHVPNGIDLVPTERERGSLHPNGFMATCKFCGERIHWGKGLATDGTGKDHRENCAGFLPSTKQKIREQNHEMRVRDFLKSKGKLRWN